MVRCVKATGPVLILTTPPPPTTPTPSDTRSDPPLTCDPARHGSEYLSQHHVEPLVPCPVVTSMHGWPHPATRAPSPSIEVREGEGVTWDSDLLFLIVITLCWSVFT